MKKQIETMKSPLPPLTGLAVAACLAVTSLSADAATIFAATDANTTEAVNTSNDLGLLSLSGDTASGTLVVTNANGSFNNGGFASTDVINTLLGVGTSLTASDTLTFTTTVDSITGKIRANGFTFGMTDAKVFGAGTAGLAISLRANNATVSLAGFQDAGNAAFGVTEASMKDGFSVTLTVNTTGYTFALTDVVAAGAGTVAPISGTFTGTEFLDNFSTGYFYTTTQRFNEAGTTTSTDTTFSEASVSVVPEPSSFALIGLGALGLLLRRRRF